MNKYEKYKDSGIQWLGQIPEHWKVIRFKNIFKEINERSFNGEEDLLSVSQFTGVTRKSDKIEDGDLLTNANSLEGYKIVRKNDLVSNIMLAWNGSLAFSEFDGITSPAYSVYRVKTNDNNRFLHYLVRSEAYKAEFKRNSSGVIESRLRLYTDDFFSIYSLIPTKEEQTAIANFLDDKTAKIDQAIAIKEKEIVLLKERRQILIQKAVTKGLDPNVKMKDSGVDWIGEIPKHWEVRKLKSLSTKIGDGLHGTPDYDDEGEYYFINGNNLGGNYISVSEITKKVNFNEFKKNRKELSEKSILLSINGTIGNVAFYRNELVMLGKSVCYVNLTNDVNKKFLAFYFKSQSFKEYCEVVLSGSTIYNLSLHSVANTKISLPFLEEQTEIVSYLEKIEEKISKAISLKQQEIEKLKEYKTVLIDNVVTGKVKVG